MDTSANPIFFYGSRSITFTQFIQKINNRLPVRAIEQIAQLLFRVPISFHLGQTHFILAQLFDNDDLKGAMERIVQNPQLNSVEFYVRFLSNRIVLNFNKKITYIQLTPTPPLPNKKWGFSPK